jgi:hypothetical protein
VQPSSGTSIWDAVGSEEGPKGTIEKAPKTDEEWTKLEYNALVLAEVANLLKTPGRKVAKPEEANSTSQPGAPELTPVQIEQKIAKDQAAWDGKVDAFQATAVKAIAAARAHNKDSILEVGSEIDSACEGCHRSTGIRRRFRTSVPRPTSLRFAPVTPPASGVPDQTLGAGRGLWLGTAFARGNSASPLRKRRRFALKISGFSQAIECPAAGTTTHSASFR